MVRAFHEPVKPRGSTRLCRAIGIGNDEGLAMKPALPNLFAVPPLTEIQGATNLPFSTWKRAGVATRGEIVDGHCE
jgi:hypothetical protein